MQNSPAPRKRASPMPVQQQMPQQPAYQYQQLPENPDFSNFDFSQAFSTGDQTYPDSAVAPENNFQYFQNTQQPATYSGSLPTPQVQSTDLVRRARNQPLIAQNGEQQEQWHSGYGGGMNGGRVEEEDETELRRRAAVAKREAQAKRKQIPPFVQKLSSFLDSNNTELIRWSDDGRSFIVLDEDEFARTLIPELFKHNNYASFVRQLNMYGFHKTVNITDGSLRQSERTRKGNKPPSMYSHPYFRRGEHDLLWLIQKPSTKSGAKRKRDGTVKEDDSDDERQFSPGPSGPPIAGLPHALDAPTSSAGDVATIPRSELNAVRRELRNLQAQQRFISNMISQLKEQNDQFYRQATAFQALHDRHENSINAILTFLATFYNRSLEGHSAQNLVNMFSNNPNLQQQGSVEEVTNDSGMDGGRQLQRYVKKPQLLLPGPVASLQNEQQPGSAVTAPNSARTSVSPPNDDSKRGSTSSAPPENATRIKSNSTASPVVKNDAPTPNVLQSVPENDDMMSLINSVNATNASTPGTAGTAGPAFDFSSALEHYQNANGNAPLTPQQRDNMLNLMAVSQAGTQPSQNNALISPQPPQMPDLSQLKETQQQLDMLTNMQRQQDERVQELNRRLQPLSPTGSIPGLHQTGDENPFDITGAPGDYDPNAFIDFEQNYDPSAAGGGDVDFDFGAPPATGDGSDLTWDFGDGGESMFQTGTSTNNLAVPEQQQYDGGRVESVSSEATSPAGTHEEPGTPKKRQRRA